MSKSLFKIKITKKYWINGDDEDPVDLCLHGDVNVRIGNEIVAENYSCTISSTAIYLLKSIEKNYIALNEDNYLLPCCGNIFIPNDAMDEVHIIGCPNGIDWNIIHQDGNVVIKSIAGVEVVLTLNEYKNIVFEFVDEVIGFYNSCSTKISSEDDVDGYEAFWCELKRRRFC